MTTPGELQYLHGFGNEHQTEALPGALPVGQFNPQHCPYQLYAEQLSSTAFTSPRQHNRRSWLYRLLPSIAMGDFQAIDHGLIRTAPINELDCPPDVMRWNALPVPDQATDFISGLTTIAASGNARLHTGIGIHVYTANCGMGERYFYCADGELLIVPQLGELLACTELGRLQVKPGELLVIPRGIKFNIELPTGSARGYVCENYGAVFQLPERGPLGANGLANERDFQYPTARFEDKQGDYQLLAKFNGRLYCAPLASSPLNVVAWTGNSAPYKYDLSRFVAINSVSVDHPDPSIFTVLTSPSDTAGVANADFVIFPPRWLVAEHSFRPPWYHRNIMSEFMGLIAGQYDARTQGFVPGGMSVHNCMSPHGPEAAVFEAASQTPLKPERLDNGLALMFESRWIIEPSHFAWHSPLRQRDYLASWGTFKQHFTGQP